MKKTFFIDWTLIPFSVLSAFSGVMLHVAGHGEVHEVWHNWAVLHVITSMLFLVATIYHVVMHWPWYKGIIKRGMGRKSKVTLTLSFIFAAVSITGAVLILAVEGANSSIGLWHYRISLGIIALSLAHIATRLPILLKSTHSPALF